jgi:hypothetical protein
MSQNLKALIAGLSILSLTACVPAEDGNTSSLSSAESDSTGSGNVTQVVGQDRQNVGRLVSSNPKMAPKNPFLVDGVSALTHWGPAQQDVTIVPGPTGVRQVAADKVKHLPGGLINISYVNAPSYPTGEKVIWLSNNNRVAKVLVDDEKYQQIASYELEGQPEMSPEAASKITAILDGFDTEKDLLDYMENNFKNYGIRYAARAGVYPIMDYEGNFYTLVNDRLLVFGDKTRNEPYSEIELKRTFQMPKNLLNPTSYAPDAIFGFNMTYDGKLAFVTMGGVLGILDRKFATDPVFLQFKDETINNSIAIDKDGGIYVVTDKYMRKVVWTGQALSEAPEDGAWRSDYKTQSGVIGGVRLGSGSGATPSLMGFGEEDKLVVITDGMEVMNIVAFWRDDIPEDFVQQAGTSSRRIAGEARVGFGVDNLKVAQSEQSVAVMGYGAFVVNNSSPGELPDLMQNVITNGVTRKGSTGVEKFTWDPAADRWTSAWANSEVSSPSIVPMISAGSNQVYVNRYVDDAWEITGLDWDSGEVITRLILGDSHAYNGAYSLIQVMYDGDIVVGGLTGHYRIDTD